MQFLQKVNISTCLTMQEFRVTQVNARKTLLKLEYERKYKYPRLTIQNHAAIIPQLSPNIKYT